MITSSQTQLDTIKTRLDRLADRKVSLPLNRDRRQILADAEIAFSHLNAGGKWKRFGFFTPPNLGGRVYLKDEILVDGVGASDKERLRAVCDHLEIGFVREELQATWKETDAGSLPNDPRQAHAKAADYLAALKKGRSYADECRALADDLATASPAIPQPDWLNGEAEQWLKLIEAAAVQDRYQQAIREVDDAVQPLTGLIDQHDIHPAVAAIAEAVKQRDVSAYGKSYADIVSIEKLRMDQRKRAEIEGILSVAVPGLACRVAKTVEEDAWADRFSVWEKAWRWAMADIWLEKRSDFSYQQKLQQRRSDREQKVRTLLAEVATLRAWGLFFKRLSEEEKAALKGWRAAVQAMGKGTGKSAKLARLRREARAYMDECRAAIPVWIMPRYLVAEMVNPEPELYDLVIVDEASQLGIDSAFLFYISKKMVVVGDDQQISPAHIGIPDSTIADLQRRWLDGIPHHHAFLTKASLYGNAKIRFGGIDITLREHFRCMPEIIQFSNDLCYAPNASPLDPLRTYQTDRLEPLVVKKVPDGYRKGDRSNAQNPPEADAIVAQIVACLADDRYDQATMGVVSLQGEAQSKLIEQKLLERVDGKDIEKRRLICGDAYTFQGDERDVIFLSMVAAAVDEHGQPQKIGILADDSASCRFNVAASRARDQLWLFHTADVYELSDKCMRHRLLCYMLDPKRRSDEKHERKFDSDFERDVFRLITERGYHVRTQVGVGDTQNHRYRIDLVVEGMQGRLAVECDGEYWHGPDRYERDMARQRDLERAGWQFVRIRGGDFYRDRDKALEPLWSELDRLGIKAGGIDQAATEPPPPPPVEPAVSRLPSISPGDGVETELVVDPQPRGTPGSVPESEKQTEPKISPAVRRGPYITFKGEAGPDPHITNSNRVAQGLLRIIEAEGPILVKRVYDVYLRGCGIKRMGRQLRGALHKAIRNLIRNKLVVQQYEAGTGDLLKSIVRLPSVAAVVVRERGPRSFDEIPPSELQLVARRLLKNGPGHLERGSDDHMKAVLAFFGLRRLTTQVGVKLLDILDRDYPYVDEMLDADDTRSHPAP